MIKRLKERKKIMVMFGIMTVAVVAFAVVVACVAEVGAISNKLA